MVKTQRLQPLHYVNNSLNTTSPPFQGL